MNLSKVYFMLKKLHTDIFYEEEPFKIAPELQSQQLGYFYFLFEEDPAKLNKSIKGFDKDGIPVNSSYVDVEKQQLHYYPISIGQFALAVFNSYIQSHDKQKLQHFLRIADWFYNNKIEDDRLGVFWLSDMPKPEYKAYAPWKSAFTQSRAISILLRAWQQTGNNKYLEIAKKTLLPYTKDIHEGGVTAFTKYGKFYEEYVASEPTMVLDGHTFSLLGLYDFIRAVPETTDPGNHSLAEELFNEGVESLIKWLPEYDLGYWIKFNMCKMEHYPAIDPATLGYWRLVVLQLKLLYKITGRKELIDYHKKFKAYKKPVNIIKMYLAKYKALKKMNRL